MQTALGAGNNKDESLFQAAVETIRALAHRWL